MSSASKRVRRFLKANTTVCISSIPGEHSVPLWTTDLQELLEEKAYWKDRAERAEANASTEEMLRKRLLQYGEFEKAVRDALRLVPLYREQNPPPRRPEFKLSPSAGSIEFAPEN